MNPEAPPPIGQDATFAEALRAATPVVWVTPVIVGVNVAVFVAMVTTGVSPVSPSVIELLKWGANFGPAMVVDGQWWRAITSAFVHVGALHLALNMYAFLTAGALAERVYGNAAFLALYVVAAVAGSLVSILGTPMIVSAGASGAVFGVYGGILVFALSARQDVPMAVLKRLRNGILGFIGYNLFYGLTMPHISNSAHLGGLVAGFAAGKLLARDLRTPSVADARRYVNAAVLVPVLAAVAWGAHRRVLAHPTVQSQRLAQAAATQYKQACDGGNAPACNNLGFMYQHGTGGLPKDLVRAEALYKQACDRGHMGGCLNLGVGHASGRGVPKDVVRAAVLFKQACDGGEMGGCLNLGVDYASGQGVPKDLVRAAALYKQACDSGHMGGCLNLGVDYASGQGVPQDVVRAAALYKQACDGGEMGGCLNLGMAYKSGQGVPQDVVRAAALYKQACDGGQTTGCFNLGEDYAYGEGVATDVVRSVALYRQACDGGHMKACFNLGMAYASGRGVPKDVVLAAALYKEACDGGQPTGCFSLGQDYASGQGVPKDVVRAATLFKQACDGGNAPGCTNLGFMYQYGSGGLPQDMVRAAALYKQGCDRGYAVACDHLKKRR